MQRHLIHPKELGSICDRDRKEREGVQRCRGGVVIKGGHVTIKVATGESSVPCWVDLAGDPKRPGQNVRVHHSQPRNRK